MTVRNGALLEQFALAWQTQAEDLLKFARAQDTEITKLRQQLQEQTDRADYWHARAVAESPLEGANR